MIDLQGFSANNTKGKLSPDNHGRFRSDTIRIAFWHSEFQAVCFILNNHQCLLLHQKALYYPFIEPLGWDLPEQYCFSLLTQNYTSRSFGSSDTDSLFFHPAWNDARATYYRRRDLKIGFEFSIGEGVNAQILIHRSRTYICYKEMTVCLPSRSVLTESFLNTCLHNPLLELVYQPKKDNYLLINGNVEVLAPEDIFLSELKLVFQALPQYRLGDYDIDRCLLALHGDFIQHFDPIQWCVDSGEKYGFRQSNVISNHHGRKLKVSHSQQSAFLSKKGLAIPKSINLGDGSISITFDYPEEKELEGGEWTKRPVVNPYIRLRGLQIKSPVHLPAITLPKTSRRTVFCILSNHSYSRSVDPKRSKDFISVDPKTGAWEIFRIQVSGKTYVIHSGKHDSFKKVCSIHIMDTLYSHLTNNSNTQRYSWLFFLKEDGDCFIHECESWVWHNKETESYRKDIDTYTYHRYRLGRRVLSSHLDGDYKKGVCGLDAQSLMLSADDGEFQILEILSQHDLSGQFVQLVNPAKYYAVKDLFEVFKSVFKKKFPGSTQTTCVGKSLLTYDGASGEINCYRIDVHRSSLHHQYRPDLSVGSEMFVPIGSRNLIMYSHLTGYLKFVRINSDSLFVEHFSYVGTGFDTMQFLKSRKEKFIVFHSTKTGELKLQKIYI
ncbi:MAG: hypothetical protein KUG82_15450 [Pseudomonadales bacterium]|nr:hypothetical protein [Pseudomonadales bacterium]